MSEQYENKALPFEVERGWTAVPNAVYTVYMKHPAMNAPAAVLYGLLLKYYNAKYDYAFPTREDLAIEMGVSTRTISTLIGKLSEVELIIVEKSAIQNNSNNYFFPPICETIEELEEKFPEISEHLRKLEDREEAIRSDAEADKRRLKSARKGGNSP